MKTIVLIALLAAAGCSKKKSADCGAIAKGMDTLGTELTSRAPTPEMKAGLTEMVARMKDMLTQRCTQDKWTPETVDCFAKVTGQADMQACESKLTEAQRTKLRDAMREAISSMRMSASGPGHPPTLAGSGNPGDSGGGAAAPGAAAAPTEATPPPAGSTQPAAPAPGAAAPAPAAPEAPAAPAAPAGSGSARGTVVPTLKPPDPAGW